MKKTSSRSLSALTTALTLSAAATVQAASGNWTNVAGGTWSTPTNWSSNPTVPGTAAGDVVNLAADFTSGAKTITLDVNATVGAMTFGDSNPTSPSPLTLSSSNGSLLTFNNNGSGATWVLQGNTSNTSSVGIRLADNLSISGTTTIGTPLSGTLSASTAGLKTITISNNDLRLSNTISDGSGTIAINKTSGTLTLNGNNSFSGGVTSTTATLTIGHANALGTGTLTIGSAFNASSTLAIPNNVIVAGNVSSGTGVLTINGSVTNSGANRTWARSATTNFAGPIYLSETSGTGRTFAVESSGTLSGVISNFNGVGGTNGGMQYGQNAVRLWQVTQTDNTYTGSTNISNSSGIVEVAKLAAGGSSSSIGASTNAATNLILSGTLRYVGSSNAVTDRLFRVDNPLATIESSGTGTLEFSNTGSPTVNSSTRGMTLGGTNAGDNIFRIRLVGTASAGVNALTKSGAGKWILTANNTYVGATNINGGTLLINGTHSNGDNVGVASGATLGGTGTIGLAAGKSVSIAGGGTLAPGASPGTLTVGTPSINTALVLNDTSVLAYELNAADQTVGGGVNDLTVVNGALTLDGVLNVTSGPLTSGTWRLFTYTGLLTDNALTLGSVNVAFGSSASIDTSTTGQVNLVVVVPEPASLSLLAFASAACLKRRRRIA